MLESYIAEVFGTKTGKTYIPERETVGSKCPDPECRFEAAASVAEQGGPWAAWGAVAKSVRAHVRQEHPGTIIWRGEYNVGGVGGTL